MGLRLARLRFDAEVLNLLPEELSVVRGLKLHAEHFANDKELIVTVSAVDRDSAERAAQLAGVVAQSDPTVPPLAELKLAAVRMAKISGSARPGDPMCLQAEVTGRMGHLVQAKASVLLRGQTLLVAELTLSGERPLI
jgi:hypothetical protein